MFLKQYIQTTKRVEQMNHLNPSMQVSSRTVDITPSWGLVLAGNGSTSPYESIQSRLEANFLLIREDDQLKLFLTFDLLFVGPDLTSVLQEIAKKYLKDEHIWICASHTHNAPATDIHKPQLGKPDKSYLMWLKRKLSENLQEFLQEQDMQPAFPVLRTGKACLNINRRKMRLFTIRKSGIDFLKVRMGPNPWGRTDSMIRRLDLVSSRGEILAVAWHYTCHPTSFHSWNIVSAHFPGEVRKSIRREFSTIPILFFQGFAGDVRPRVKSRIVGNLRKYLQEGRRFRDFTEFEYNQWARHLSSRVNSTVPVRKSSSKLEIQTSKTRLDPELFVLGSQSEEVVIQIATIGPICLVGISAEPSIELSSKISKKIPAEQLWLTGYLEDVYGYLPTAKQIRKGGYEVDGFCPSFNCERLVPGGDTVAIKVMNDRLGKPRSILPKST
jgi:hypothetical protein